MHTKGLIMKKNIAAYTAAFDTFQCNVLRIFLVRFAGGLT